MQAAVGTAREQASPAARQDVLQREREANEPRINDRARRTQRPPAGVAGLKRSLGFVVKNPASSMVEHNRDMAEKHLETIEEALRVLGEVANCSAR